MVRLVILGGFLFMIGWMLNSHRRFMSQSRSSGGNGSYGWLLSSGGGSGGSNEYATVNVVSMSQSQNGSVVVVVCDPIAMISVLIGMRLLCWVYSAL